MVIYWVGMDGQIKLKNYMQQKQLHIVIGQFSKFMKFFSIVVID